MCFEVMTTSSSGAHPALGPSPIVVVLTNLAPDLIAARALAVAMPKSLWVTISMSKFEICLIILILSLQVNGSSSPRESSYPKRSAPASLATLAKSIRNPRSAREASSAMTEM